MPGMNGLEMIAQIKKAYLKLPFIILSGYQSLNMPQKRPKFAGINIIKPVNELAAILEKLSKQF